MDRQKGVINTVVVVVRQKVKDESGQVLLLTVSDVHLLHPRVHDDGRLVLGLASRFPLHLSGLCVGHPSLALQISRRVAALLVCCRICVPIVGKGRGLVPLLMLMLLMLVRCILSALRLHRVLKGGLLLCCVRRRRGLHGLISSPVAATVLRAAVVPPLVTKMTVIFFARGELRLSIFTAHHVGVHD